MATTQIGLSRSANLGQLSFSLSRLFEVFGYIVTFPSFFLRESTCVTFASMGDEALPQRGLHLEVRLCTHRISVFPSTVAGPPSAIGRAPVWQHTFDSPSAFSRRAVVSYWRKYVHEVLVNRLGLSLPRKSVVRLTDRPDMTLDVYRGRRTTTQQQQQPFDSRSTKRGKKLRLADFVLLMVCSVTYGESHRLMSVTW